MLRGSVTFSAFLGFLATVVATAPSPAAAQPLWMPRESDHTITLEMLRPNLEDVDAKFLSAAYFLSGRVAVSPTVAVVGELPFSNHKSSYMSTDSFGNEILEEVSSATIGNPYLGLEARVASGPVFVEFGARPPLASDEEDEAVITGIYSDATRWAAFLPDFVLVEAAFNVREVTPSKIAYRLRLSPVLAIPTEGGGLDPELFAIYSFLIGYHGSKARIGGGMSGQALVSEDFGNLGQRTVNQLEIHADFLSGSLRPGLDLHLPLDTFANFVPVVLGVSVSLSR
jgi:hypothetical protein